MYEGRARTPLGIPPLVLYKSFKNSGFLWEAMVRYKSQRRSQFRHSTKNGQQRALTNVLPKI